MNPRRVMFVATVLIGVTLTGCGSYEDDPGQPVATVASATNPNYSQEYKTGSVSATYSRSGYNSYTLNWSNMGSDGDVVYGTGWNPGNDDPVTYTGSFTNTCGGCFGIYGWTKNSLVEYYVCDSVGAVEGPHTSSTEKPEFRCSFVSDGDVYDVYYNMRIKADNIEGGKKDFPQYISVRRTPRTSGTITVKNHFNAWATSTCGSMKLGSTRERQVLGTEGWGRSKCGTASGSSQATLNVSTPAAVTGVTVKTYWNYIDVSWSAASGATSYVVTRAEFDSYNKVADGGVVNATVSGTTYSDMVPNLDRKYQYSVAASNGSITGPSPKAITILPAPSITATISGSTVKLSWPAVTGATKYVVDDTINGGTVCSGTQKSCSITVSSGTYYLFMVKASDGTTLGMPRFAGGVMP